GSFSGGGDTDSNAMSFTLIMYVVTGDDLPGVAPSEPSEPAEPTDPEVEATPDSEAESETDSDSEPGENTTPEPSDP
ncbi:MAG: hypothetical protein Q7J04_01170, partial [Microcella sp.]|nr:hypothetical protein [Microcella sp.]